MKTEINDDLKNKGNSILKTVGLRELRANLSDVFHLAVYNFKETLVGNAKRGGNSASIISTELLDYVLENYKFNSVLSFDNITNQWEVAIEEIGANSCGDTKEEAIKMMVDTIIDLTEDYLNNLEVYIRVENTKKQYPYFLRISHCGNREDLLQILNLKNV